MHNTMLIEFLNHAVVMLCQARTTKADEMPFFGNNVHVHIIWNSNRALWVPDNACFWISQTHSVNDSMYEFDWVFLEISVKNCIVGMLLARHILHKYFPCTSTWILQPPQQLLGHLAATWIFKTVVKHQFNGLAINSGRGKLNVYVVCKLDLLIIKYSKWIVMTNIIR